MAIVNFSIDFTPNTVSLTFDAPVTLTSADLELLSLQNASTSPTLVIPLTGSTITTASQPAAVQTIDLSFAIVLQIKSQTTAFINSSTTFINDTFSTPAAVRAADTYITDTVGPFAIFARYYNDIGRIDIATTKPLFNVNRFTTTLVFLTGRNGTTYTLTGGTATTSYTNFTSAPITSVTLTETDKAAITALGIGTSVNNTYIAFPSGTLPNDWSFLSIIPVSFSGPIQVSSVDTAQTYQLPSTVSISNTLNSLTVPNNAGIGTTGTPNIVTVQDDAFNLSTVAGTLPAAFPIAPISSAVSGGGKTVIVSGVFGDSIDTAYSSDNITWAAGTMPVAAGWSGVAYGNGVFVAVSGANNNVNSDIAATSTDGITWTQRTLPTAAPWASVTFGNGVFVAATVGTIAATSTDGITWTQRTLPLSAAWGAGAYGNNVFVLASNQGGVSSVLTSPDGITWTQRDLSFAPNWVSIAFGNGTFVALGRTTSPSFTSTDGITWTQRTLPYANSFARRIAFGDGVFLYSDEGGIYGPTNQIVFSRDNGVTWERRSAATSSCGFAVFNSTLNTFASFSRFGGSDTLAITAETVDLTTVTGDLTVTGKTNLGPVSNVVITGGTTGQFIRTVGGGNLTFASPTDWTSVANIAIGDTFIGSAVGTTAAGATTTTPPDVTASGGGSSTAAPSGGYRCLGGISTTQALWVRTF